MAVKPIISSMTPWDARLNYKMYFSYSGDLPVSNRLIIYDASSLATIYDQTETASHFYHTVPANALTNGVKYAAQLTVTDMNGITSGISDKVFFWCLSTPQFYFSLPTTENINTPSVTLKVEYAQSEGEQLYSYQHFLYDNARTQLTRTDIYYTSENLQHTFNGLTNKAGYYLRSVGTTKNGISVDTGYQRIYVNYEQEEDFEFLDLTSDINGTVVGHTNMVSIDADEDASDYVFLNSYVQLLGRSIHYNSNFNIEGDFTLSLKITKVMVDGPILLLSNGRENILLTSNIYEGKVVYRLTSNNGMSDYNIFSPLLSLSNDSIVVIHIRRINNLFKLVVQQVI